MKCYFLLIFCAGIISANAQDSTFKELTGRYKFPAGSIIEEANVTVENNVLTMSSTAGTSTLERIKGDTFNVVSFNGICIFKREEAGKINGVHVDASGYILDGVKDVAAIVIADETFFVSKKMSWLSERSEFGTWRSNRVNVIGCIIP